MELCSHYKWLLTVYYMCTDHAACSIYVRTVHTVYEGCSFRSSVHIQYVRFLTGSASNMLRGGSMYRFFPGISLAVKNLTTPGNVYKYKRSQWTDNETFVNCKHTKASVASILSIVALACKHPHKHCNVHIQSICTDHCC